MTNSLLRFAATACILCAGPGSAAGQDTAADLAEWAEVYEESRLELLAPVFDLQDHYARNLEKLRADATAAGQLERVLAVKAELDGFRNGETPSAGDNFPEFKRLQDIYRQTLPDRRRQAAQALAPLTASYKKKLAELQTELTKQEKLAEALQVKAVFDAMVAGEEDPAPAAAGAANKPGPPPVTASRGVAFREGRLHAVGRLGGTPGKEIDISPAEGIADFIDVTGHGFMWVALRKEGTAVGWHLDRGAFSRPGIRKLVKTRGGKFGSAWGITTEGRLIDLIGGEEKELPGPVAHAEIEETHAIALLEDGAVHVWGDLYQGPAGSRQPMPKPPADALRGVAMITASRYCAFVVTKDGDLKGWSYNGHVFKQFPKELRGITRLWANAFEVIAEVRGRNLYSFSVSKLQQGGCTQISRGAAEFRVGNEGRLILENGQWQIGMPSDWDDVHGERAIWPKLDGSVWPFLFQEKNEGHTTSRYLLWLAP